jgi:Ser/Thr protein kinase RdoA (MazF antagonist)
MDDMSLIDLKKQFASYYGLRDVVFENLNTPVNDILIATTPKGMFAFKLYHKCRNASDVQWEVYLIVHLINNGVPAVKPLAGDNGYVGSFSINGQDRIGVLSEWAVGGKPKPDHSTYFLLGKVAAQIHQAADTFEYTSMRDIYDSHVLIDEQLQRMKNHLIEADRWEQILALGERLKERIANQSLDIGICHMDLTLNNVHLNGNTMTVFDFDSAGQCWRAIEPQGALRFSRECFKVWLAGYRSVRPFSNDNETAVSAFVIIGDLRVVAWKLGVAASSRGKPLLTSSDLPRVVDEWLRWEDKIFPNY